MTLLCLVHIRKRKCMSKKGVCDVIFMATSSFDKNVIINKNNQKSLIEIIDKQYDTKKSFSGIRKIEKLNKNEIKNMFNK